MNTNSLKTNMRYFYAMILLLSVILPYSCGDSNEGLKDPVESAFTLQMKGANAELLIGNTSIYMFNSFNQFVEKKLNVQRDGNKLTTSAGVGIWNIALLTCDEDISGNILVPAPLSPMASTPMWQTKLTVGGDFLSQTPDELRYVLLEDVEIKPEEITRVKGTMYRNVAKIQVILKEYTGFDLVTSMNESMAYAELLDVPTTLAWNGNLYPDGANPTISQKPLREYFEFTEVNNELVADTLNFIVPAHRGDAFVWQNDDWIPNPGSLTDVSTHHLKLRVSMPLGNNEFYGLSKDGIEIEHVPQPNKIIRIYVTFRGVTTLDIKIDVQPWEDWITQEEEFS